MKQGRRGAVRLFFAGFALRSAARLFASTGDPTEEVLESIVRTYESIHDYQCRLEELSVRGRKREERVINFYFKKPKLIRMDVLKGNRPFDAGSVGVYTGGDKVKGHRGGGLEGIVLNLPKDSPLVTTIRGVTFEESDLETVLENLFFYRRRGVISMETTDEAYVFTCVAFDPEENDGISRDLVWIDKRSLLIVRSERYEGNDLVQAADWKGFILNAGLPVELFDVKFDVRELERRGLPLLGQEVE